MSGGITTCPLDSDDLDTWAEEFIVRGSYMCDQRWTYQLLEGQRERIKDYIRWNVPISRNADGEIRRFASRGMVNVRGMQYQPKVAMRELRRQITARGARILDRLFITELLTADGEWPTQDRHRRRRRVRRLHRPVRRHQSQTDDRIDRHDRDEGHPSRRQ